MYLPPVTPAEARSVYALVHVTAAMARLEKTYTELYFGSLIARCIARIVFVSVGLSVYFRNTSNSLAVRILEFQIVQKIRSLLLTFVRTCDRCGAIGLWQGTCFARESGKLLATWHPQLARSAFIYYLLYSFVFTAIWLPLSWYAGFLLPHQYGLSRESIAGWFADFLKDSTVDNVLSAVFVVFVLWGFRAFPKRWPYLFAFCSAPVIMAGIFLDPFFSRIDNHFTKLPQTSPLYAPLHNLAAKAGVPNVVILVADKSKQTFETNAYVTGVGSSAQIVLWDTTIKRMPKDEVIAIVGHELGHYVEHHVVFGGLLASAAMFAFLPLLKTMSDFFINRYGTRWKVTSLSDPAVLPIVILCLNLLSFAVSPATNAVSRLIEHRADSFGLALTGNRLAMGRAMVDLSNEDLGDPYPTKWEVFWLYDHPPFGERIEFSLFEQPIGRKWH